MLVSANQPISTPPRQTSSDLIPFLTLSDAIISYLDCLLYSLTLGTLVVSSETLGFALCGEWLIDI